MIMTLDSTTTCTRRPSSESLPLHSNTYLPYHHRNPAQPLMANFGSDRILPSLPQSMNLPSSSMIEAASSSAAVSGGKERAGFLKRFTSGFGGHPFQSQTSSDKDQKDLAGGDVEREHLRERERAFERDREISRDREMEMQRLRERERERDKERNVDRDRQSRPSISVSSSHPGSGSFSSDRRDSVYAPESWAEAMRRRESMHKAWSPGRGGGGGMSERDREKDRESHFRQSNGYGHAEDIRTGTFDESYISQGNNVNGNNNLALPPLRAHLHSLDNTLPTSTYPFQTPSGSSSRRSSPDFHHLQSNRHPSASDPDLHGFSSYPSGSIASSSSHKAPPPMSRPHSNSVSSITHGTPARSPFGGYSLSNASSSASLILPSSNGTLGLGNLRPGLSYSPPNGRTSSYTDGNGRTATTSSSSIYGFSTLDRERDHRLQRERELASYSTATVKIEEGSPRVAPNTGFRSRASSLMQGFTKTVHASPSVSSSGCPGPDRSTSIRGTITGARARRSSSGASKNGITIAHPATHSGYNSSTGHSTANGMRLELTEETPEYVSGGTQLPIGMSTSVGSNGEAMDSSATRRLAHLQCEQRRRESINGGFAHLRTILPETTAADSKAAILQKAINYIQNLEQMVRASGGKIDFATAAPANATSPRKRRRAIKREDRDGLVEDNQPIQAISPPLAAQFAEMTTLPPLMKEEDEDIAMLSDDEDELARSASGSRSVSLTTGGGREAGAHDNPLDLLVGVAEGVRREGEESEKNRLRVQMVAGQVEKKYEGGNGGSWAHVEVNA